MNKSQAKRFLPLLHSIQKCNKDDEKAVILQHLDDSSLKFVCRCVDELLNRPKKFRLDKENITALRTKLAPHKRDLLNFANSSKSLKKKRHLIDRQFGGALFSILFATIIPILADLVIRALSKKKK